MFWIHARIWDWHKNRKASYVWLTFFPPVLFEYRPPPPPPGAQNSFITAAFFPLPAVFGDPEVLPALIVQIPFLFVLLFPPPPPGQFSDYSTRTKHNEAWNFYQCLLRCEVARVAKSEGKNREKVSSSRRRFSSYTKARWTKSKSVRDLCPFIIRAQIEAIDDFFIAFLVAFSNRTPQFGDGDSTWELYAISSWKSRRIAKSAGHFNRSRK